MPINPLRSDIQHKYGEWIEAVNDEGIELSDWEEGFMESITDQFDANGSISPAQAEVLERIYDEKTF